MATTRPWSPVLHDPAQLLTPGRTSPANGRRPEEFRPHVCVILAGGGGTRLWPLSRPDRPKPSPPLFGEESLLQATVRRLDGPELALEPDDIYIVADRRYGHLHPDQVDARLVVEPSARNTAAAITLASIAIDRPPEEVMVVLPADHHIADEAGFRRGPPRRTRRAGARGVRRRGATRDARRAAHAGGHGVRRPAARRPGPPQRGAITAYQPPAFEEKPDAGRAVQLVDEPGVAWNAGMFLWQRGASGGVQGARR